MPSSPAYHVTSPPPILVQRICSPTPPIAINGADQDIVDHSPRYAHPGPPFIKNRSDGRFCITAPICDAHGNKGKAKYVRFILDNASPRAHLTMGKGHPVFAIKLRARPRDGTQSPFIPFASVFSSTGNRTNLSSIEPYNNWEIPSSKERCYSSDTLLGNSRKPDKKSSTLAPKSDTPSRSRCWPVVPSLPHDKLWTLPSIASSKPEPTAPSIHFYFAKPFSMSATTMQWSTRETTSIASCKQGDDHLRPTRPTRILHPPTWPTSWQGSTAHLCMTCTTNHSSKTEETTTGTTSEVAVFTP